MKRTFHIQTDSGGLELDALTRARALFIVRHRQPPSWLDHKMDMLGIDAFNADDTGAYDAIREMKTVIDNERDKGARKVRRAFAKRERREQ